jgi:hypothetical protein
MPPRPRARSSLTPLHWGAGGAVLSHSSLLSTRFSPEVP